MALPERGEVWLADLGFAAKIRPVLVVSVPFGDQDYALIQVIPHTSQARNAQFKFSFRFHSWNRALSVSKACSRFQPPSSSGLGRITPEQMAEIEEKIKRWLGLKN